MRRILSLVIVTAALVAVGAAAAISAPKKGDVVTVRKFSAEVMSEPKFFGKKVKSVARGDFLEVVEAKGDWYSVEAAGATGWIHKSGVEAKKVTLSTKDKVGGSGASRDEVELAGRGFTPEVEAEYRSRNPSLDFSHVDAIEGYAVESDDVGKFVDKGKLNRPGGGE